LPKLGPLPQMSQFDATMAPLNSGTVKFQYG